MIQTNNCFALMLQQPWKIFDSLLMINLHERFVLMNKDYARFHRVQQSNRLIEEVFHKLMFCLSRMPDQNGLLNNHFGKNLKYLY